MGASQLSAWALLLTLGAGPDPNTPAGPGRPLPGGYLSAEDARYLDWLVEDFLFDPRRATYVRIMGPGAREVFQYRNSRFLAEGELRAGWLVRGTNGAPDRIYFTDGESMVAPATGLRFPDFEAECQRQFRNLTVAADVTNGVLIQFAQFREYLISDATDEAALVRAAWLHRRGYDRLAAAALAEARAGTRDGDDPRDDLRTRLAQRAADAAVRAFAARDDETARAHASRLFTLYPDLAPDHPHVAAVVADMHRRQRVGIGSRQPPKGPPPEFAAWDVPRKIAYLIGALDEVEQGTGSRAEVYVFDRPTDWRVAALLEFGDAAIPALIDAGERDARLTRRSEREVEILSCGFGRGRRPETVLGVRDVAMNLLRSILRVNDFDPTGPAEASDEDDSPSVTANRLRQYWARYGRLPLADRMMTILTDATARPSARREAGVCLAESEEWSDRSWTRNDRRLATRPSPFIARYTRPTIAKAILAAMDREREVLTKKQGESHWERAEDEYLGALIRLRDVRVGPELARRAAAAQSPGRRLTLARTADFLGFRGPLVQLTREVAAGSVRFPPPADGAVPSPETIERAVRELVDELSGYGLAEVEDALYAVGDPRHPYFPMALRGAMTESNSRSGSGSSAWQRHPLCLSALRHALTDVQPSGGHSYRRGTEVEDWYGQGRRLWTPEGGANPEKWFEHVEHRVSDVAAERLGEMTIGLPEYHPLRRDRDRVLAETRALLVRHARGFRRVNYSECQQWGAWRNGEPVFVPDIKPLGRPATAADVAAGRAVFELAGAGKVVAGKLPEWVVPKGKADEGNRPAGRVVQAEVGPDGMVVYGVILRYAIKSVRADEVEPLAERP